VFVEPGRAEYDERDAEPPLRCRRADESRRRHREGRPLQRNGQLLSGWGRRESLVYVVPHRGIYVQAGISAQPVARGYASAGTLLDLGSERASADSQFG